VGSGAAIIFALALLCVSELKKQLVQG
jgi:hypothetical protein